MQTNSHEPQEQQQEQPQPTYSPTLLQDAITAPALNPPDSATWLDAPVDAYLDAVCAQMPAEVPAASVEEMRREMREHLSAAIVAHCELGQTEAEAVHSALTQFGTPRAVARHWQQEWTETLAKTNTVSVWSSLKTALKTWMAINAVALVLCMALPPPVLSANDFTPLHALAKELFSYILVVVLPLAAGVWIGLRVRRHAVVCTLISNLVLSPFLAIQWCRELGYWWHFYELWLTGKTQGYPGTAFSAGVGSMIYLMPIWVVASLLSCGVVVMGRNIGRRIRRRQLAR